MPGITIEFTEEELAELRAEAKEQGLAIKRLAHDILTEDVVRRRQRKHFTAEASEKFGVLAPEFLDAFEEGDR
ncbi:hypothetical protein [Streptomyces sp. Z26]|uniref:hypothetical protein n=1 Tax=Streptomyces TaxID=1883 RepID=UPI000EF16CFF|nr:hypothetical protein [Streptomyces sp. Z26]RLL66357.1 hypothetical protein D7M15_05050 [Streptomyces sp. Z26]